MIQPAERPPEDQTAARAATLRGHPRLLLLGSLVYLGLIFGVMLWRGIDIEPQWVALALLVIAAALGRGKQFIFDFLPFLLLFFAYEVMRGFAAKTGFPTHDISPLEAALFFGHQPVLALQSSLYNPDRIDWLDVTALYLYFMHFVVPVAVGFVFWLNSRALYWRYAAALLLLSFLAFVTYLFFPSTPPWLQFPEQVHKVTNETVVKLGHGLDYFISPIYHNFNPNAYAAFPSLHAAYPLLAAIYAWSRHRRLAMLLIVWTAGVWFSIVYLGEHYVVDALDGVIYLVVAAVIVERFARLTRAQPDDSRAAADRRSVGLARIRSYPRK